MNKMKILTGCIALIGCVGNAIALTAEEAKAQVITQEKAWSDAVIHHDIAKVASILADDFVGIDGRGFVSDKAAELKEAEPPAVDSTAPQLLKEDLSDFTARIYGNTAVLNLTNTAHFYRKKGDDDHVSADNGLGARLGQLALRLVSRQPRSRAAEELTFLVRSRSGIGLTSSLTQTSPAQGADHESCAGHGVEPKGRDEKLAWN